LEALKHSTPNKRITLSKPLQHQWQPQKSPDHQQFDYWKKTDIQQDIQQSGTNQPNEGNDY
jgi:hypothetical protein